MDNEDYKFDKVAHCALCRKNGDDYYLDGDNNWINACIGCTYNDKATYDSKEGDDQ